MTSRRPPPGLGFGRGRSWCAALVGLWCRSLGPGAPALLRVLQGWSPALVSDPGAGGQCHRPGLGSRIKTSGPR